MDEASSRFVDRLIVERMLSEKLSRVHHAPSRRKLLAGTRFDPQQPLCGRWDESGRIFTLLSPFAEAGTSNAELPLHVHETPNARAAVLLIHGLFEDNRDVHAFLIQELNRLGLSVYASTLPHHHERTPAASQFSGEFFLSADVERTLDAFTMATAELELCQHWLRLHTRRRVFVVGFSMGATVSLLSAAAGAQLDGLCAINPAAALSTVIWSSPLCSTIRSDLEHAGFGAAEAQRAFAPIDPLIQGVPPATARRTCLFQALYDVVTEQAQYDALARALPPQNVRRYKAGHLNTLRVPRLGGDVASFFAALPPLASEPRASEPRASEPRASEPRASEGVY